MSVPYETPPSLEPGPPLQQEWRRLAPLMLVVNPVQEIGRFLPLVIAALVFGGSGRGGGNGMYFLGVAIPVVIGLSRFLTTRYRITATQIELRRGLISRSVLTAPFDRIRTVELTATLIHRVLGLSRVRVGTGGAGSAHGHLVLDSLATSEARSLRTSLLRRAESVTETGLPADLPASEIDDSTGAHEALGEPAPTHAGDVVVTLDPRWVKYAPLGTSGLVAAAAILGFSAQFADNFWASLDEGDLTSVQTFSPWVLVAVGLIVVSGLGVVLAIAGYLVANWGFTVRRDLRSGSWQVTRGLLTTTETSLDQARVRGLEMQEPLGLRLAGARKLQAIVIGMGDGEERGTSPLLPAAPREVAERVGATVAGDPEPLTVPLVPHGRVARRRRWTRALLTLLILGGPMVAAIALLELSVGLYVVPALLAAACAGLAHDRYAHLGHALTERYVVFRSGSLAGRRVVLQRDGIIGWNLTQSFFQRRAGVTALTATTAAGRTGYTGIDLPDDAAVALALRATPGLLDPFLEQP